MRTATLAALLLFAAQDDDKREVKVGTMITGAFSDKRDQDGAVLVADEDAVWNLTWTVPEGQEAYVEIERLLYALWTKNGKSARALRFRIPRGRHKMRMGASQVKQPGDYRLEFERVTDLAGWEVEPNNDRRFATPLAEGDTIRGGFSHAGNDDDWFSLNAGVRGPRKLVVKRLGEEKKLYTGQVEVIQQRAGRREIRYAYRLYDVPEECHFYPVLEPGPYFAHVTFNDQDLSRRYELTIGRDTHRVTADDRKAGEEAIRRGVDFLLSKKPDEGHESHEVGVEGLVLAALAEGAGAKERLPRLEKDHIPWLEKKFRPDGRVKSLSAPTDHVYELAIAILALAEASLAGSARAKELCERAVAYLVAAQVGVRRPPEWGGSKARDVHDVGGWRYGPTSEDGDLSVTGWALVALTAADSAGVKIDGMRDAVEAGLKFVEYCAHARGFTYEPKTGGPNNIRNSIGALICLLYGLDSAAFQASLDDLDRHLYAATQVDDGDDHVSYYAYYATRAGYLRGGYAWETWRSTMLRQLLRMQRDDGSWTHPNERSYTARYSTALAVMVLRLCLNEAPRYLKQEVRGF